MDTQPTFGPRELLTHIIGGIANALCERDGEPQQRQFTRSQVTAHTIATFQPRDAIEAMLAGHCVMFHELIVDSVHTTLCGEEAATRRATRSSIVAMDKAFGNNLTRLERYRTRHAAEVKPVDARAETEIADRVHRHQSPPPAQNHAGSHASASETGTILHYPSPETPDPGQLTQDLETEQPGEILATNPRTHHSNGAISAWRGNRKARRHPNP